MSPATDEHTAPDHESGAVLLHGSDDARTPVPPAVVTEREFWRAVAVTVVPALRPRRR
jgi:hypothetical protein